jgi:hypothetical protein
MPDLSLEKVVLEQLRFAITQEVAAEQAHQMIADVRMGRYIANTLLMSLQRKVYAHRTYVETQTLPCRGRIVPQEYPQSVLVALPQPWWRKLLRLPERTRWLPVTGTAEMADARAGIEVAGEVDVRAEYFSAFPDAPFDFPDNLGPLVTYVQTQPPGRAWWFDR